MSSSMNKPWRAGHKGTLRNSTEVVSLDLEHLGLRHGWVRSPDAKPPACCHSNCDIQFHVREFPRREHTPKGGGGVDLLAASDAVLVLLLASPWFPWPTIRCGHPSRSCLK